MRGTTAYVDDFYFGAGPTSTSAQYQGGSEGPSNPTGNTTSGLGGEGTTMAASLTGNGPTAPISKLNPTPFLPGLQGVNPLWFIPIGLGLLVLIKIVREGGKKSGDFSPLKADAYWFFMTVLAAVTGIPLVKAIASKYAPQPVRDYIANA